MQSIRVEHISKRFGDTQAVKDISFEVVPGEIFGLLGPNGSGKTTSIRVILDIYQPDSGTVSILGGPMSEAKKNQIGYLPEERGLYQDILLEKCLVYLATLKGMSGQQIRQKLPVYLEEFDLSAHKKKKVKELSKGMQQKAQLIATLIHDPQVIIIDEPFSALDPVNTQLVKDILKDQRGRGKTIIMCTHQMNQVEQLCDKIVLVNQGEVVLQGGLQEIYESYATDNVLINTSGELPAVIPGVQKIERLNTMIRLEPQPGIKPQDILNTLVSQGIQLNAFEIAVPSLDEIFIKVVKPGGMGNEQNL
ncbi:MAG TPA: ATP-binding cassette domain-containing protein [Anaerolineaceae bacterium]|nr:ATP-binding cassette domain-containing protein [Anaerolineaceae bacterium]HOR84030.1 ATP-binding cassette domain-containing protein [Anaerolineaceae bacterium]HPL43552.1 ATP-binding cassette domain-containing protein [Anaerolineaceae bacterium]